MADHYKMADSGMSSMEASPDLEDIDDISSTRTPSRTLTEKRKHYVARISSRTEYDWTHRLSDKRNLNSCYSGTLRKQSIVPTAATQNENHHHHPSVGTTEVDGTSVETAKELSNCDGDSGRNEEVVRRRTKICSEDKLFDVCLLVGYNSLKQGYVKSVFPPESTPPEHIENLIFPHKYYSSALRCTKSKSMHNISYNHNHNNNTKPSMTSSSSDNNPNNKTTTTNKSSNDKIFSQDQNQPPTKTRTTNSKDSNHEYTKANVKSKDATHNNSPSYPYRLQNSASTYNFRQKLGSNRLCASIQDEQNYSLVLTDENGVRKFGYCRKILPENSEIYLPLVYCIVTETRAPGFYFKILQELESRHGQTEFQQKSMLRQLYDSKIPRPGQYLHIRIPQRPKSNLVISNSRDHHQQLNHTSSDQQLITNTNKNTYNNRQDNNFIGINKSTRSLNDIVAIKHANASVDTNSLQINFEIESVKHTEFNDNYGKNENSANNSRNCKSLGRNCTGFIKKYDNDGSLIKCNDLTKTDNYGKLNLLTRQISSGDRVQSVVKNSANKIDAGLSGGVDHKVFSKDDASDKLITKNNIFITNDKNVSDVVTNAKLVVDIRGGDRNRKIDSPASSNDVNINIDNTKNTRQKLYENNSYSDLSATIQQDNLDRDVVKNSANASDVNNTKSMRLLGTNPYHELNKSASSISNSETSVDTSSSNSTANKPVNDDRFALINSSLLKKFGLKNKDKADKDEEVCYTEIVIKRPYDFRLENNELSVLFECLNIETILNVFGSLLIERKVVLIGDSLSTLCSCVEGLQSALYPFSWQHTLVTVLPHNLVEITGAPIPLLAGILHSGGGGGVTGERISTVDEGILIDMETSRTLSCMRDEHTLLPTPLRERLRLALSLVENTTGPSDPARNVMVGEAFLKFFVACMRGYEIGFDEATVGAKYNKKMFIQSHANKSVRHFLEWFTETAMFTHFIRQKTKLRNRINNNALRNKIDIEKISNTTATALPSKHYIDSRNNHDNVVCSAGDTDVKQKNIDTSNDNGSENNDTKDNNYRTINNVSHHKSHGDKFMNLNDVSADSTKDTVVKDNEDSKLCLLQTFYEIFDGRMLENSGNSNKNTTISSNASRQGGETCHATTTESFLRNHKNMMRKNKTIAEKFKDIFT